MPTLSKAVLMNLGVFLAENGIRRNVGSFSYNFSSPSSNVLTNTFTLLPGETLSLNTPMSVSAVTLLNTNGPLSVDVTPLAPATPYSLQVTRVHLVDSDVRQMVLTNNGTINVNVTITQA